MTSYAIIEKKNPLCSTYVATAVKDVITLWQYFHHGNTLEITVITRATFA